MEIFRKKMFLKKIDFGNVLEQKVLGPETSTTSPFDRSFAQAILRVYRICRFQVFLGYKESFQHLLRPWRFFVRLVCKVGLQNVAFKTNATGQVQTSIVSKDSRTLTKCRCGGGRVYKRASESYVRAVLLQGVMNDI